MAAADARNTAFPREYLTVLFTDLLEVMVDHRSNLSTPSSRVIFIAVIIPFVRRRANLVGHRIFKVGLVS